MTRAEVLGQLYADPTIAQDLNSANTEEEMRDKLAAYGLKFEQEEFHQLITELCDSVSQTMAEDGELSEDALDAVSGGVFHLSIPTILTVTATGTAGTAVAVGIAAGVAIAGVGYLGYWAYKKYKKR